MKTTLIIEQPFVINPFLSNLIQQFGSFREKKRVYGVASCMLITSESGGGKSQLAKHYAAKNPPKILPDRTIIPVLHFELRSVASPQEFLRSLLIALGDPQFGRGARNIGELYSRVIHLMKLVGVELLILDEVQVIIERRSEKVLTGIADLFKDLIKDTEIPIIFMGMPWAKYLVDSNRQLKRRISHRHVIPPYRVSQEKGFGDYRKLLKILTESYGFADRIKLEEREMALRFFSATAGNLAATANLICDAFIMSQMSNMSVGPQLFVEVCRSYGMEDEDNAFLQPMKNLVIRELVGYSDWKFGQRANKNAIVDAAYIEYGVSEGNRIYQLR